MDEGSIYGVLLEQTGKEGLHGRPGGAALEELECLFRTLAEQPTHLTDVEIEAGSTEETCPVRETKLEHQKFSHSQTSSLLLSAFDFANEETEV